MKTEQLYSHIAYTLEEGDKFSDLGLKTLQTRPVKNCVVPGRLILNGSDRLVYKTEELSSVASLSSRIGVKESLRILWDLSALLTELEDSAFLDKRYIDLDAEHVYLRQEDETFRFILVPAETASGEKAQKAKSFVGGLLARCEKEAPAAEAARLLPGITDSTSAEYSQIDAMQMLDVIRDVFAGAEVELPKLVPEKEHKTEGLNDAPLVEEVELRYRGPHGAFAFFDRKEEFFIGKEVSNDGVINLNSAVSRRHCKIVNKGVRSFVEDLGSKNGTMLNGVGLLPGQRSALTTGDKLQIADMVFDVTVHQKITG
ncbi:MAG: FHA domain-containing protein [Butyrivibrio sp.]|nr:FHA domain-containing protein [Butyrivibrio sp.]